MNNFWKFIAAFGIIIAIILLLLLLNLKKDNDVVITGDTNLNGPEITRTDPFKGSINPKVVVVHYGDFSNETSASVALALTNILAEHPQEMVVIWKDFPNESLRPESINAAIAARCAQDQGYFWGYHDLLFSNQRFLNSELYTQIAREIGLRENKFNRCLKRADRQLIDENYAEAVNLGLTAAPTIFINGQTYTGKIRQADLSSIINNLLKQ